MDFDAFAEAARDAMAAPIYDRWMVGYSGPQPSTDTPTQEALQVVTDQLIEYEQALAEVPAEMSRLDDLASRLNYFYDPQYAAGLSGEALARDRSPEAISARYEMAVERLKESRDSLVAQSQILQALVSTYTAARAKIEHDLQWQEYVQGQFGVDPSNIPREIRAAREHERAAA